MLVVACLVGIPMCYTDVLSLPSLGINHGSWLTCL
jgi:hypothetical protein